MYHFKIYGNNKILSRPTLSIHASRQAPESLYASAKSLFQCLLKINIALAGGWQSNLERYLLHEFGEHAKANIVIFIAKMFKAYQLPQELTQAYKHSKIAIVEPAIDETRIERKGVEVRDRIVDDLIEHHLFFYIQSKGRLESRLNQLLKNGKQVYVFNHPVNNRYFYENVCKTDEKSLPDIYSKKA